MRLILVMGVCGSGKSTLGSKLAEHLGASFLEGDNFHSVEAKNKMAKGEPLNDEDRLPWIQRINEAARQTLQREGGGNGYCVVSCSALKSIYRDWLFQGFAKPAIVCLHGDKEVWILQRSLPLG